ncbi:MAG: PilZ domain-containing protein [Candidatus Omnitrophota bacterium]
MERQNHSFDRRSCPRYETNLQVNICGLNSSFTAETKNISGSGLYCTVDKFIPVMTKLSLIMIVPLIDKNAKVEKEVKCAAVVVRIDPDIELKTVKNYQLGLFFTEINDKDRDILAQYIRHSFLSGMN